MKNCPLVQNASTTSAIPEISPSPQTEETARSEEAFRQEIVIAIIAVPLALWLTGDFARRTALIGSILIAALTSNLITRVEQNPAIPPPVREQVAQVAQKGIPIVPVDDVEQAAEDAGVPSAQAKAIADDYGKAQLHGLERAIGAVAIFALLALWFTRGLPGRAVMHTPPPEAGAPGGPRAAPA